MNAKFLILFVGALIAQLLYLPAWAQIINTVAGGGSSFGNGGPALNAIINSPEAVFVDRAGNIYFPDSSTWVRKVDPSGIITTIAGTGVAGYSGDGGLATNAQINGPFGVYVDPAGNIYIGCSGDSRIRKIDPTGIISTFAGNGTQGYTGDGGLATSASIGALQGITGDESGNIYFTDFYDAVIRKVNTSGTISTIAGTGTYGTSGDGGPATSARIASPSGISIDPAGNIYFGDDGNSINCVRKINASGIISTVAGGSMTTGNSGDGGPATSALFGDIESVCSDDVGNLYIVDAANNRIRRVDAATGIISPFAGTGTAGFSGDGGLATLAQLSSPWAIALDTAGNFYITDIGSERIRKITIQYTLATTNTIISQYINGPFSTNINDDSYNRLLSITPTAGSNILNGNVSFQLTFDLTVQTYVGDPYVQRHYDIVPASNAATAQATVKLYFLQSEFDAYNSYVTVNSLGLPLLPSGGIDNGNVLVSQFHGVGTAPGNYTGATLNIIPTVNWNATNNWWEVTFPVTGFSGFYVSTANIALPLTLLNFTGNLQNNKIILNWNTTEEINTRSFVIERSQNQSLGFTSVGIIAAMNTRGTHNYSYTDNGLSTGTYFYRLKMVDVDGRFTYSKIVAIKMDGKTITLQIAPNPAKNILNVQVNGGNENATLQIIDITGRKVKEEKINLNGNTSVSIDINNLQKGTYNLVLKSKTKNEQKKFIKE